MEQASASGFEGWQQARMRCQRYLEGLVGEEQCRGVHVVLARESWFQPEQFCSQEPSTASVVDM